MLPEAGGASGDETAGGAAGVVPAAANRASLATVGATGIMVEAEWSYAGDATLASPRGDLATFFGFGVAGVSSLELSLAVTGAEFWATAAETLGMGADETLLTWIPVSAASRVPRLRQNIPVPAATTPRTRAMATKPVRLDF